MKHLPIFLNVTHQPCLVIGGGPVAARKSQLLLRCRAHITVVAPTLCASLTTLMSDDKTAGAVVHHDSEFNPEWLEDQVGKTRLIIAATNDSATNLKIAELAERHGIPCNVADNPDAGSFILPSVVDRDPIVVAISSGGTSPILARLLRARIEAFIPESYRQLALLAGEFRDTIKQRFNTTAERKRFWESILHGRVAELMLAGKGQEARAALLTSIDTATRQATETSSNSGVSSGEVYLVGAGPGDPDLLTFRALRLMHQSDVVLYDRLVADAILDLCPPSIEKIYVGKRRADHAMPQADINQTLIKHAKAGKRVLRLKGGDPFIFGRGGEEIETLAEHNIPFQIVPGITAASGCASYAGIPLTHRDHAQSCVFVTGHLKNGSLDLDWQTLVNPAQTLICYMGLVGLPVICKKLMEHGMSAEMPAALIERGTTSQQIVHTATVGTLATVVANEEVHAPTLIIIGSVVSLREKLKWYTP